MPSVQHLIKRVRAAHEQDNCFTPRDYFPVRIYPANSENPYALARKVRYSDGVVSVSCDEGFQWDGASIPPLWVLIPWLVTFGLQHLSAMGCIPSWCVWLTTLLLLIVTVRIAPYLQKMGRHVRAGCIHDRLFRTQAVSRPVADAIMLEIMRYDGVALEARWLIYLNVRLFGWMAYRKYANKASVDAGDKQDREGVNT